MENTPKIYMSAAIGVYEGHLYSNSEYKDYFIKAEIFLLQIHNDKDDRKILNKAKKSVEEILERDPDNYNALMLMGRCYMEELSLRRKERQEDLDTKYDVDNETLYDLASDYLIQAMNSQSNYVHGVTVDFLNIIARHYYYEENTNKFKKVSSIILLYDPENLKVRKWLEELTKKEDQKRLEDLTKIKELQKRLIDLKKN